MHFPMDFTSGSLVLGVLNGTMLGNARLVPGVLGNALYLDGQRGSRVDYGVHTQGCFFDPDQCVDGTTQSLWLKLHEYPTQSQAVIDTGACQAAAVGFCLNLQKNSRMRFEYLGRSGYSGVEFPSPSLFDWHFFVVTIEDGVINVYVDGINVGPTSTSWTTPRRLPFTRAGIFHIGPWTGVGRARTCHVTLSELCIWYEVLRRTELMLVHMLRLWSWCWDPNSQIAKTLVSTAIRYRSDAKVSDRCLIDVAPRVLVIWAWSPCPSTELY